MRIAVDESPRECHGTIECNGEIHHVARFEAPLFDLIQVVQSGRELGWCFSAHLQPSTHSMTMMRSLSGYPSSAP
jgi:hypothetical protein